MKNNVPKLRFPEFSDEWHSSPLNKIATTKVTNSFSRENLNYENGNVKNIHYGDIHTKFQTLFDIEKERVPFINSEISLDRVSKDNYCIDGDLIFADASEDLNDVGKSIEIINIKDEKLLSGLHTILVRPQKNIFQKGFAGYLFKSNQVRLQIQKESQGSKVLSISGSRLLNTVIFYPSLKEQIKIADVLTSVDDKIQQLTQKKELLEHYKTGVMQQIFSQQIRFKDDSGNDYPNWQVNKFGAITVNVSKKNLNSTLYPIYSVNNKTGFIPQSEQFDGLDSNERNYDISLYKIVNKFTFAYNPARINVGSLGYSGELENIIISSLYVCFKTIDIIDDTFLLQYFKSNFFKKSVLQNVEGGVREYLFYDNFAKIKINTPSKSEQVKISSFLTNIDDKITQVNTQLEKTKLFKKALLQQLFI